VPCQRLDLGCVITKRPPLSDFTLRSLRIFRVNKAVVSEFFLRSALSASYLSACADRFGFWGAPGEQGVAWGNWQHFIDYVAVLNWFVPASFHSALGWAATVAEVVIAVGLLLGWKLREFATASGILLFLFALTMTLANGFKPPLDYSVWTASAASFFLAYSLDTP